MFERPAQMEPMLPTQFRAQLEASALDLVRESAGLANRLRTPTRGDVVELLRSINSYYSNLIEGHGTRPVDIERALRGDYSRDPRRRLLQLESRAHVEVQRELDARLAAEPTVDLFADSFLRWLHAAFYERIPDAFRVVEHDGETTTVVPGALRTTDVRVGRHVAPRHEHLGAFLARFREDYSARALSPIEQIIAVAASHHRLAWIHPFTDGNGRVVRLFTDAYLRRLRLYGYGLWSVSRGLARRRDDYFRYLEGADEPRRGDLDGRGSLTDRGLAELCSFFLDTCLDQVRFMRETLDIDGLEDRICGFAELSATRRELPKSAGHILRDVLARGEIARGEVARITGQPERTARRTLGALLERGLLQSNSEKGPVRLAFPTFVVPYYFPRLYPASLEDEMRRGE